MKDVHKVGGRSSGQLTKRRARRRQQGHPQPESAGSRREGVLGDERLSLLFQKIDTPYQAVDHAGRIVQANRAWLDLLGYTRDEVIGRPFIELISASCETSEEEILSRVDLQGRGPLGEVKLSRGDGLQLTVLIECLVRRNEFDGVNNSHFILRHVPPRAAQDDTGSTDLTHRLIGEPHTEALGDSLAWYRLHFEHAPVAVLISVAGEIAFADRTAAMILGAEDPAQLTGVPFARLVHSQDQEKLRARSRMLVKEQRIAPLSEYRWMRTNGEVIEVEAVSVPFTYRGEPAVQTVFTDITRQKRAEEQIKASLEEKEILLREIDHRVKNNLQVISSLLRFQSRYAGDRGFSEIFEDCENRIRSMAMVHEEVYRAQDLSGIDFHKCVERFCIALFQVHGVDGNRIAVEITSDRSRLAVDKAIACGLIVSQLVSNAFKYGFPENRPGRISIDFRGIAKERLELRVSADGPGMPERQHLEGTRSLDLQLVEALAKQLRAEVRLSETKGTEFRFRFKR